MNFISALAGLRGLAALLALWGRLGLLPFVAVRPLLATDIPDDLFFCLSGFLLCVAYSAGAAARLPEHYWRRRAWRLAPAAAVILAALLIPSLWAPPVWPILVLLLCHGAVFPPFFWAARRQAVQRAALPAGAAFAFAAAVLWLELRRHPHWRVHGGVTMAAGPLPVLLAHGAAMFLAGACAGLIWQRDKALSTLAGDAIVAAFLAAGFTIAGCCLGLIQGEFAAVALPALVLGLAAAPGGGPAGLLAAKPWQALGRLAYPLYLLFGPVQAALAWAAPALRRHPEAKAAATALAVLLLSAAVSALLPRRMRVAAL